MWQLRKKFMAYTLKQNQKVTMKGLDFDTAYLVVDKVEVNKQKKQATVTYYTFPSKALRSDANNSLKHNRLVVTGKDYDTYFAPSVVAANGDQFDLAYQWLGLQDWTPAQYNEEWVEVAPAVLISDLFESDEA